MRGEGGTGDEVVGGRQRGGGLAGSENVGDGAGMDAKGLSARIKVLAPRWFVMRDAQGTGGVKLVQSRCTLAWMRGPMTRREIARVTAR